MFRIMSAYFIIPVNLSAVFRGETTMAETKPKFPSRQCPKCGKFIHIKSKKHPECGWVMDGTAAATSALSAASKPNGKAKKEPAAKTASGGITLDDIQAVKAVVDRMGAVKVRQLAEVLSK